jgi:hypothetical protein
MKIKISIAGLVLIDIEENNPENFTKLLQSVSESLVTKSVVGDEMEVIVPTPKQTGYEAKNIGVNFGAGNQVTADKAPTDQVTVDLETGEKWTEDITKYIMSKTNYEHDLGELMDNVLGKRIKAKEDQKSYDTFLNKVRLVRNRIKKKENIEWDSARKHYGHGSYPLVYKIKQSDNQRNQNE